VNPYLFIVGAARSGTTLLQRMLDAHPELAVLHETHWIPRVYEEGRGITADGAVTAELLDRLLTDRRFRNLGLDRPELERLLPEERAISYADYISRLLDRYGELRGKRLVGEKTPGYVRDMGTLHALWPEARFVHVIRDGRDVTLSMLEWKRVDRSVGRFPVFEDDPVSAAALWWKWHVELGRREGRRLGPALYREVRYERLVADPAGTCAALCEFLRLRFEESVLAFHEGRQRDDPELDAKRAWRPITAELRDWRTQMSHADLERFEAAAGELLDELGYPRAHTRPAADAVARAARVGRLLANQVREATRYPLPP
jgi:hypothetical protein